MRGFPDKCVIDTNVLVVADLFSNSEKNNEISKCCIEACYKVIRHVMENGGLVIDENGEIFKEYRDQYKKSHLDKGQPGPASEFIKWVMKWQWQWQPNQVTRVKIHRLNDTYKEFPEHDELEKDFDFDNSDRKFVAVANAYPGTHKPPIFQATDVKWWGWKEPLCDVGIKVRFLCPDYVKEKYPKKKSKPKT